MLLATLLEQVGDHEMTVEEVIDRFYNLTWVEKYVDPDGEVWWDEGSSYSDFMVARVLGHITDDERNTLTSAFKVLFLNDPDR